MRSRVTLVLPLSPSVPGEQGPQKWGGKSKLGVLKGREGQEEGHSPLCPHPDPQLGKQVCQLVSALTAEGRRRRCCWLGGG